METIYLIMAIIGVFLLIKAIVINGKDSDKSAMYAIIGNTLCIPNIIIFSKTSIIISVVGLIAFIAGVIINASKLYASAKDKETYIEIKGYYKEKQRESLSRCFANFLYIKNK